MPLPQVRKVIALQIVTKGQPTAVAYFARRQGGMPIADPERKRQPWGGFWHTSGQPVIEPVTLSRPVENDALTAILGYAQRLQVYGLGPLRVVEREIWPDGEAAHVWDSAVLIGYGPEESDIGKDEVAWERVVVQPHEYARRIRQANGEWITTYQAPLTPWAP